MANEAPAPAELQFRGGNMEWRMSPIFQLTTTNASVNIGTPDRLRDMVCDSIRCDRLHRHRAGSGLLNSLKALLSDLPRARKDQE